MAAKRVLVVEDEFLIALDIAGVLEQAGITVIGPAGTVGDALQAIDGEVVHGALLDAHLAGEPVTRIADALKARGIPFAFVSGYGREQLPPAYRGAINRAFGVAMPLPRRRARRAKCFIGPSSSP
jgi:CheY-like chemotaxis protein